MKDEKWDAKNRELSGVSQTVAGDRYELRILTYTDTAASFGKVRTVTEAAASYFGEIAVRFAEDRQTHRYQPDRLLEVVRRPEFP